MAFPTIPTTAAGRVLVLNQADTTATRTFPAFSGLTFANGDLLVAIVVGYRSSTTNAQFSGWTNSFTEFHDSGTSTTEAIGCAYKFTNGTETGSLAVTQAATITGYASMILMAISGAHASTPPEAGGRADGTTAAANPVSFDPAGWAAEDTLWIAVGGSGETALTSTYVGFAGTAPTNYTNYAATALVDDVIGRTQAAVAFRQVNASAEDVGVWAVDLSAASNSALIVAVRPPPVNATITPTVVAAPTTVPQAHLPATVTPTKVTGLATVPTLTGTEAGTANVQLVTTIPTPTVSTGSGTNATATPAVAAGVLTVPTPTVTSNASIIAAVVAVPTTVPTPVVTSQALVTPANVACVFTAPTPAIATANAPTNSFEGGSNGVTITTANSGGTSGAAWDATNIVAGGTDTYDSTLAVHGGMSNKVATGATVGQAYNEWSTTAGSIPQVWFREYLYFTTNPAATHRIWSCFQGATLCAAVRVGTLGKLEFVNAAGSIIFSTTASIPLNQWFRIEGYVIGHATVGQVELKLFNTVDSATADETQTSAATQALTGVPNTYRYGAASALANIGPFWLDDVGLSAIAYLGPVGGAMTVTAAVVAAPTTVPTPGISAGGNATVLSTAVPAPATIPTPTVTAPSNATVTPANVAGVLTVPTPAVTTNTIVNATVAAAVATIPTMTGSADTTATPAVAAAATTIPTPSVSAGGNATVNPAAVAAAVSIPTPGVTAPSNATAGPAKVAGVLAVPTPTVTSQATATAGVVAVATTIPAPGITAGGSATINAVAVAAATTIPAPTVTAGASATITPAKVTCVVTIPVPGFAAHATITATVVNGHLTVGTLVVANSTTVTAIVLTATTLIPSASVITVPIVPPITVTGSTAATVGVSGGSSPATTVTGSTTATITVH